MTQMLLFTLFLKTERKLNCSWGSDPWGSHSDLSWGFREIKQRKWQFLGWLDHAIIHALVRSPRLRPRWSHPPSFSSYARTRITKFGFKAFMFLLVWETRDTWRQRRDITNKQRTRDLRNRFEPTSTHNFSLDLVLLCLQTNFFCLRD